MSTATISRRYARALFDLSVEGVKVADGLEKLATVAAVDEMREFLDAPQYAAADKAAALAKAAGGVSDELSRLVSMLCERGKGTLLPEILDLFRELEQEAASEVLAEVSVATKIDSKAEAKLAKAIESAVGGKVRLEVVETPEIIGGIVVRIGDRLIDASVRSRLESMRRAIAA